MKQFKHFKVFSVLSFIGTQLVESNFLFGNERSANIVGSFIHFTVNHDAEI